MHFDDRLATVLRMRVSGGAIARIQLRQLLDLLGSESGDRHGPQIDAAYDRLAQLAGAIPQSERAAMLRDGGLRLRSPRLVAALGADADEVAQAAIGRAELDEEQWLDVIPALPPQARSEAGARADLGPRPLALLRRLGAHGRGLPPPSAIAVAPPAGSTDAGPALTAPSAAILAANDDSGKRPPAPIPADATEPAESEGIGALVRKIEAYRQARADSTAPARSAAAEALHPLTSCDLATDATGMIHWAETRAAPMLIGLNLAARASDSDAVATAIRRQQPLRGVAISLSGGAAIAGAWQLDALPRFDPLDGHFQGYRGRLRRAAAGAALATPPAPSPVRDTEAERLRQMLHELRTPVNAIQGFAEVIQQQLFGPTPHEYRAHAATIASDAARILAAFDELERLARLDSGVLHPEAGACALAPVVEAVTRQLAAHTAPRASGFALRIDDAALTIALAPREAELILWRLLATAAGLAAPGEMLKLRLRGRGGFARLDLALPAQLAELDEPALFGAGVGAFKQAISAGVFGVGFALRLARSEARAAGGRLALKSGRLRLELPIAADADAGLTADAAGHTQQPGGSAASPGSGQRRSG